MAELSTLESTLAAALAKGYSQTDGGVGRNYTVLVPEGSAPPPPPASYSKSRGDQLVNLAWLAPLPLPGWKLNQWRLMQGGRGHGVVAE